ncbi:MAG: hypothetical protein GXO88_01395 [Chlorobi bacterium]|nr:hypothetical protein [Chlorobiota bacterium]
MKKSLIKFVVYIVFIIISQNVSGQEKQDIKYTIFNPNHMEKEYFVSTNSGIFETPFGIKIGYICNPGIYLGLRYGKGEEWEFDQGSTPTNLFSIVAGLTKPLIIKNAFSLVAQLGAGYGEWWDTRRVSWTKSGFEVEGGLLMKKRHIILNLTGNWLNGSKTYSIGDLCLGIGYVF